MSKSSAKSKTRGSSNKKGSRKGKGSLQNAIDKVTEKSGLGSITRKVARVVKNSDDEEEVKTPRRQDVAPRTEETPLIEEQKIPAKLEKSSLESAATAAKKARRVVVLGPLGDFLTADTTLIFVLAVLTSIYPTYVHWSEIVNDRIPFFPVTFCWLVVAHTGGWCVSVFVTARSKAKALQSHLPRSKILPEDTPLGRTVSPARARPQDKCMLPVDEQPLRGGRHRLLRGLFRGSRLRFESLEAPVSKVWKKRPAWSNLSRSVTVTDPTADLANGALMNRLLRTGNFRLVRKSKLAAKGLSTDETSKRLLRPSTSTPSTSSSSPRMGGISIVADADTLNDYVVDSLFKLRGMDVFLTDEVPEGRVGNHPWLIQQGLRDAPTFILNVLTQWGNLILYFEMPEWVEDWDGSPELVSDKEDVKAFKRFFIGNDEYRNERFKLIPSLADGPLAVKVLAPPKKETAIDCSMLHVGWYKYASSVSKSGRKLRVSLEAELDCLSSKVIRGFAGIVKKYLQTVTIDAALVIGLEKEPHACLCLCRFDHIDISDSPQLPDRYALESEEDEAADLERVSHLMGMSQKEMKAVVASA